MKLQGRNLSFQTLPLPPLQGEDVKLLQSELLQLGFAIPAAEVASRSFGEATFQAVIEFQGKNGLATTGVVDPATAEKINAAVNTLQPPRFIVQGQVRRADGKPVGTTIVRAFAVTTSGESQLDEETTDATGSYKIQYDAAQPGRPPGQAGGPDLIVRAFDPSGAGLAVSPVIRNAGPVERMDLFIQGQSVPSSATFVVRGQVRRADFSLFAGAVVRASDKDLRGEEPLGQAITDQEGRYEINYTAEQFRRAEKGTADLIVRVYANIIIARPTDIVRPIDTSFPMEQPATIPTAATGASTATSPAVEKVPLATSPIIFNAPPIAVVDLVVGGATYTGPSEYEEIVSELTPLLQTVPPVQPADLTAEDIAFLIGETGLLADRISFFAAAAKLSQQTDLPPEIFYGFARKNLPTELNGLLGQSEQVQRRAIEAAINDNIIPLRIRSEIDKILARLQQLIVKQAFEEPREAGRTSISALLGTSMQSKDLQEQFVTLYVQHQGTIEDFWKALREHPQFNGEGVVDKLQLTLQFAALTRSHLPLIQELQQKSSVKSLRDLAKLDDADWLALINKQANGRAVGFPPDVPGKDDAAKAANYARTLTHAIEKAFPTAVIADRISRDSLPGKDDLVAFFANNPEFDLVRSHVETYLSEKGKAALAGVADKDAMTKQLKSLQRVHHVTPRYEEMRSLLADGLNSAQSITRIGQTNFVTQYAQSLGGERRAQAVYGNAQRVAAMALVLFSKYSPQMNPVDLVVTPKLSTYGGKDG